MAIVKNKYISTDRDKSTKETAVSSEWVTFDLLLTAEYVKTRFFWFQKNTTGENSFEDLLFISLNWLRWGVWESHVSWGGDSPRIVRFRSCINSTPGGCACLSILPLFIYLWFGGSQQQSSIWISTSRDMDHRRLIRLLHPRAVQTDGRRTKDQSLKAESRKPELEMVFF